MNDGWSFCIVTATGNENILLECIEKIHLEFLGCQNYEIIVIGNPNFNDISSFYNTHIIPFKEEVFHINLSRRSLSLAVKNFSIKPLFYKTGAISHKKNLAAQNASYSNLCVMHDYVGLEPGWKAGFDRFGYHWDIAMSVVSNKNGERHRDWMVWDHPKLINKAITISPCLLPYDKYTKYMYISGAYFCVKRSFFLENPLNENKFWGEGEDVEWSLRVRELTKFFMNKGSTVKYLKLKDTNDAPNCESWIENEKKMKAVLNSTINEQ